MDKNKRVLVGMSGGIDSTATCLMLQEQGYEVVGLTMRVFDVPSQLDPTEGIPRFLQEAQSVAKRIGVEHFIADERKAFQQQVVKTFVDEYLNGRTPNPCVMCNPLFKFRVLTEWADRLGCASVATGHYVQLTEIEGHRYLVTGDDALKDQSYFLWQLGQPVLQRCLFPLGSLTKVEVRKYLEQKGFALKARGGESMEVCFIEKDYREFLRQQVPDLDQRVGPGLFVDKEGHTLGHHRGFPYYTIGQRKGLEIALGKPAYVLKVNASKNTVMLGEAEDLLTPYMLIEPPQWVDPERIATEQPLTVRIRYRSKALPCRVLGQLPDEERWMVQFGEAASAITPGQSAVFYVNNRLVGGAYIASQRGMNQYIPV